MDHPFSVEGSVTALAAQCHKTAVEHGWWDLVDSPANLEQFLGEKIALMHSELSEALEAYRDGIMDFRLVDGKPDGFMVELADCIIRIMDTAEYIEPGQLGHAMVMKMVYNEKRPYRHGGKRA